ncbi:ABC transporter permease [Oscillatoria amoena NRMC-F 0135]|nr:ABC transporter permease [Oscillatoria amoena NRMC-F 0135]
MIRNYLKTAFRNLWREKGSTLINVSGLTLGITCSLILFLLIRHATSFDTFHSKRDRIYRVVTQTRSNNGYSKTPGIPAVLPDAFRNDFPEAEEVTFLSYRAGSMITIPQVSGEAKKYNEPKGVVYAQPNFFKIFDRKVIQGDAEKGLDEPNEAILSRSSAIKYFGREDAIGEVIKFNDQEYRVTAIMEDYPNNTDLPFDVMLSAVTIKKESDEKGWNSIWSDEQCYILLKEGETAGAIEARMPEFVKKYLGESDTEARNHPLQPFSEIHFDDRYSNFNYNTVPKPVLLALGMIAIFLIITACINFINLTTAEAIKRSKEVGIRKSLGGTRSQLITQFLGETSLVTIIAVLLSLACAQLALSFLNPFLELNLSINLKQDGALWIFLGSVTLAVSLLSGLYPSFVVSGLKPALAMKNLMSNRNSSGYVLRRGLVVTQFFISQFFIIGTIVLIRQMNYFQTKDLGFQRDAIISVPIPERESPAGSDGTSKMRTLKNELVSLAGIELASLNSAPPASGNVSSTGFTVEGRQEEFVTQVKQADDAYFDLFELNVLAGDKLADRDTATGFVVNEKLIRMIGYTDVQEAVGKEITMWGRKRPIIGVVNDFHTMSLLQPIEPVVMLNRIRGYETLSLKISSSDMKAVIGTIQQKWEQTYPDHIFSYEFLDEQIRGFYDGQRRMSVLLGIFTSMAIFIGCLGLLGLVTFMVSQKTKEIGVRKVLGASVESILVRFSKEFVFLVLIGFALAAPLSWWVMRMYLDQFAYRIELGPSIFLTGVGISLLIALLTVSYRSIKAASVNPVESLRYE